MSDLGDWFRSIPLITRYWFAGSIAVPLVGKLGLVSPVNLFLWPDAFIHRFQGLQTAQEILMQSYKRDMELLGRVQLGEIKVIKELEHL